MNINFATWLKRRDLFNEAGRSVNITVDPKIKEVPVEVSGSEVTKTADAEQLAPIIRQGLQAYYQRHDPKGWRFLKARYDFHIADVEENYNGLTFDIKIIPITPEHGEEEWADEGDPAYDYYQRTSKGKTGKTLYKTPQDAIESIPHDKRFGYRGMAWEEWQIINRTGKIQSKGTYNIGQEKYTMFGYDPSTALHYAHGFAPLPYQVGYKRPGVVIAVPRTFLRTHKDDPNNVPQSELGLYGSLDKSEIAHAWMLTLSKAAKGLGYLQLRFEWRPDWDQQNNKDSRMGYFVLNFNNPQLGSAMLSGGVEYAIKQMF